MGRAFPFLDLPIRKPKPRTRGLTIVRDRMRPLGQQRDYLSAYAPFIDYVKFNNVSAAMYDERFLIEKIKLYKEHDVKPFFGGILFENCVAQDRIDELFDYMSHVDMRALEISDNIIEVSLDLVAETLERCVKKGIEVFFEWGLKYPEKPLDPDEAAASIKSLLDLGITRVVVEQAEVEMLLGTAGESPYADRLVQLVNAIGIDRIIPETERKDLMLWLIRHFGPEVNIGPNVDFELLSWLEPARVGIGRELGHTTIAQHAGNNRIRSSVRH